MRWQTVVSLAGAALALAGCGGGQLAGSSSSTPSTRASTTPATSVPTVAQTVARKPPPRTTSAAPPARTTTTTHTTSVAPPPANTTATTPPAHTTPAPSGPTAHAVDEQGTVSLVQKLGTLHYIQRGHVTGTIEGELMLETKPSALGGVVTFTLTAAGGSISGRGVVTPTITAKGKLKPVTGHARITGGTGTYVGISGHDLLVTGKAALDGSRGDVRLTGVVTY